MQVSFGSTYRIQISQPGVNKAKKQRLRELTSEYGGLISSSNTGTARVSIYNTEDALFENKLRGIGYTEFQKFGYENLPSSEIDTKIKKSLQLYDYIQKGKLKAKKSTNPI